jgi:hypothetical protein
MFIHFLLTRFNLKIAWRKDKNITPIDEKWLEHRFYLFDRYCYPSVKNQSNKNFKWLVFFDLNTPDRYKEKIEKYKQDFENFIPVFTDKELIISTKDSIYKFLNKEITHIITSRLDNDDAIHKDYIDRIQLCFNNQDYYIVDIVYGYVYCIEPFKELAIKRNDCNPFISLIETANSLKTIYLKQHKEWCNEKRKSIIYDKLWLQIIHSNNAINKMSKYPVKYINNYGLLKDFSIFEEDITINAKDYFNVIRKNIAIYNSRAIKIIKKVINT